MTKHSIISKLWRIPPIRNRGTSSPRLLDNVPSSGAARRLPQRSVDQPEPLIDALHLLSDYPTQEGNDLPAMRAWILASTSPPGGVFGRKSARPTAGRRYGRLTSQGTPCGMQGGLKLTSVDIKLDRTTRAASSRQLP